MTYLRLRISTVMVELAIGFAPVHQLPQYYFGGFLFRLFIFIAFIKVITTELCFDSFLILSDLRFCLIKKPLPTHLASCFPEVFFSGRRIPFFIFLFLVRLVWACVGDHMLASTKKISCFPTCFSSLWGPAWYLKKTQTTHPTTYNTRAAGTASNWRPCRRGLCKTDIRRRKE